MSHQTVAWLFPALLAWWLGICALMSLLGGWHYLAARFGSDAPIEGRRFRFQSAAIGWSVLPVHYRGCLFITIGRGAFALSVSFPFLILHPRLMIPWSAVQRCEYVQSLFGKRVAVFIAGFNRRLLFRGSLGEIIFETWSRSRNASRDGVESA